MLDIFDELNSELRNEKILKIFKKYGFYLVILIILITIISIGLVIWHNQKEAKQKILGEIYYNIHNISKNIDKNSSDNSVLMQSLDHLIDNDHSIYFALAIFKKANILNAENKYQDAVTIYDKITSDSRIDNSLRDLSSLMAANIIVANNLLNFNIENRLAKLTNLNNCYYNSAMLLKGIYLKKHHRIEELKTFFDNLDSNISRNIKEKLEILIGDENDK